MRGLEKVMLAVVSASIVLFTAAFGGSLQTAPGVPVRQEMPAYSTSRLYESEIIRQAVAEHEAAPAVAQPASSPAGRLYESEIIRQAVAEHEAAPAVAQAASSPAPRVYESEIIRQAVAAHEAAAATTGKAAAAGAVQETTEVRACSAAGKPWVVSSAAGLRLPGPPDRKATRAEIEQLKALAAKRDPATLQQIAYWNAGSPSYRWVQIALNQLEAKPVSSPRIARAMALMNVAIYDALLVACDAKAAYNRPYPDQVDKSLNALITNSQGSSYPSEHAVVAGAAAAILTYLYPADGKTFAGMAQQAGQSRLAAGVAYPSDVKAGLELGQAVAQQVIEHAQADGSDAKWTGSVPSGPGLWNGTNPIEPLAGTWRTWVLASGSQLRPPAPPAYDSKQKQAELQAITTFTRTFTTNAKAMYWQSFDGIWRTWYDTSSLRLFEYGLDQDALRAARDYAAISVAHYDAIVACWDAKYTYWAIRPFQLDPKVVTLFPTPNHPSYPAAHGCASGAISGVMEYLYPAEAAAIHARADEAGTSRMWAGIHFQSDIAAGLALGRAVAQKVVDRIESNGVDSESAALSR